ncbi:hypothetical protein D3C72_1482430 [compost metagenome]
MSIVTPIFTHRDAGFPVLPCSRNQRLLNNSIIAKSIAYPAVDDTAGLNGMDQIFDFLTLFFGDQLGSIKPDNTDRTILCQQFAQLRFDLIFNVFVEVFGIFIRIIPGIAAPSFNWPVGGHIGVFPVAPQ